jgi:hypothetical protein
MRCRYRLTGYVKLLMRRPAIPDFIRVSLVALGICCLALALFMLCQFRGFRASNGTTIIYPVVEYERTNMIAKVAFAAPDGSKTVVMASEMPSGLHGGEHFTVIYNPQRWRKDSWLLRDILRIPILSSVLGIALASAGLFSRSRRRELLMNEPARPSPGEI